MTIPEVYVHVHMSDNRETKPKIVGLPVDVDNKEILCDDKRGLCAFSRER